MIKTFLQFITEYQDGCQKLRENEFWESLVVDCMDNLWVKNFFEIALAHSISEINTFLRFTQKLKMAAKRGGKMIFGKMCQ